MFLILQTRPNLAVQPNDWDFSYNLRRLCTSLYLLHCVTTQYPLGGKRREQWERFSCKRWLWALEDEQRMLQQQLATLHHHAKEALMPTNSLQNIFSYTYIYISMTGSTQATNAMEQHSKILSHQLKAASGKPFYSCSLYKGVEPIRQTDGGILQSVEPKLLATVPPVIFFFAWENKSYSLETANYFSTGKKNANGNIHCSSMRSN